MSKVSKRRLKKKYPWVTRTFSPTYGTLEHLSRYRTPELLISHSEPGWYYDYFRETYRPLIHKGKKP